MKPNVISYADSEKAKRDEPYMYPEYVGHIGLYKINSPGLILLLSHMQFLHTTQYKKLYYHAINMSFSNLLILALGGIPNNLPKSNCCIKFCVIPYFIKFYRNMAPKQEERIRIKIKRIKAAIAADKNAEELL